MHGHARHVYVMHAHVMHAHIMHICFMSQLTATCQLLLNTQTGLTAACQLKCFKISPTAKIGMSLKMNSVMPPAAKG
jgi:hypothetical protein